MGGFLGLKGPPVFAGAFGSAEAKLRGSARIEFNKDGPPDLVFREEPEIRSALERVIEAEAACCPFLSFSMRSRGEELVLTIEGPDSAEPVVRDLLDRFGLGEAPVR